MTFKKGEQKKNELDGKLPAKVEVRDKDEAGPSSSTEKHGGGEEQPLKTEEGCLRSECSVDVRSRPSITLPTNNTCDGALVPQRQRRTTQVQPVEETSAFVNQKVDVSVISEVVASTPTRDVSNGTQDQFYTPLIHTVDLPQPVAVTKTETFSFRQDEQQITLSRVPFPVNVPLLVSGPSVRVNTEGMDLTIPPAGSGNKASKL